MIFDSHAHYDDKRFDGDREELLNKLGTLNIGAVVNVASDYKSLSSCRKLALEYPFVYSTSGIHPSDIKGLSDDVFKEIEEYAKDEKCVAIGEIGLDYYWEKDTECRQEQKRWFKAQLDLAQKLDKPVVIHSREACEDTMDMLKIAAKDGISCVVHCFSYSPEIALEYVKMGYYIGVGGVLTYKNAKKLIDTVKDIPLKSILLETDCPYLTPHPFRGDRNDSTYLPYVVRKIAGIKGIVEDEVIEVTTQNAKKFYRL